MNDTKRVGDELALREASVALIKRTPGAATLNDVEARTGESFVVLLARETGMPVERVEQITGERA